MKKANGNNQVRLTGNLGKDPEIKIAANGKKHAKFQLATHSNFKNKAGEKTEATEWHNVSAWGKVADRIERDFKKGSFVSVEGALKTRSYTDASGEKRKVTEVLATGAELRTKTEAEV